MTCVKLSEKLGKNRGKELDKGQQVTEPEFGSI